MRCLLSKGIRSPKLLLIQWLLLIFQLLIFKLLHHLIFSLFIKNLWFRWLLISRYLTKHFRCAFRRQSWFYRCHGSWALKLSRIYCFRIIVRQVLFLILYIFKLIDKIGKFFGPPIISVLCTSCSYLNIFLITSRNTSSSILLLICLRDLRIHNIIFFLIIIIFIFIFILLLFFSLINHRLYRFKRFLLNFFHLPFTSNYIFLFNRPCNFS